MFRGIRADGSARSLFATLMVLALAMRIAVPAGFMPTATTDGGIVVSICTGDGALSQVIDIGKAAPAGEQKSDSGHCVFASAAGAAIAGGLVTAVTPLWRPVVLAIGGAIADLTVHRLAAPPPPSQGPPARG